MKKTVFPILLASIIFLTSCVSVSVTRLGTNPVRPPIPVDQVKVYKTKDEVPSRYEKLARLNGKVNTTWSSESALVKRMKKKAGRIGANAILLDELSEPAAAVDPILIDSLGELTAVLDVPGEVSAAVDLVGAFLGMGVKRKGRATAIYVTPAREDQTLSTVKFELTSGVLEAGASDLKAIRQAALDYLRNPDEAFEREYGKQLDQFLRELEDADCIIEPSGVASIGGWLLESSEDASAVILVRHAQRTTVTIQYFAKLSKEPGGKWKVTGFSHRMLTVSE
jgi:hypothetical protein